MQNTPVFSQFYKTLNPAQKQAVDTIEGPVIVIAGPGTGKTTILTLRIANILLKTDTAPENILALTFTESGAYVMRRKLLEIIGASAYKVNIHTFHGFAEKIIQEYPDYFPRIIGSKIITDAEQIKIIEKLVQSRDIEILRPYGDPIYYVRSILSEIHILKRENISPKDLLKSIKNSQKEEKELSKTEAEKILKRDEKNKELALIYERYEAKLAEQKFYDFDDMLIELIKAMEKEQIFKLMLQESYHYILADEHQDANASQNRILELLVDFHDSPNLFIVGDDKQAIYRFQGASLENFLYFKDKYKGTKVIELEHNYRSQQTILDASHSLISQNPTIPGRERTKLISLQVGAAPIYFYEFSTQDDELEYLASSIFDYIKRGDKPQDLAVLYRTNNEANMVASVLKAFNIPYRIESDYNILNEIEPTKLIIIAKAINDLSNSANLARALLLREIDCDPASIYHVFNYSNREKLPLSRVISDLIKPNKKDVNINTLIKILDKNEIVKIASAYNKINEWVREAQIRSFPVLLQKIIQETNMIASVVASQDSLDRLSSLEAFFDKVIQVSKSKKTFLSADFIEYIDIVNEHGLMSKKGYVDHVSGVRLMTTHKSKGLEFDRVFVVNFYDGNWGNRSKRNLFNIPIIEHVRDVGRIEDERRLFYVAMTRARRSVHVSFSRVIEDKEVIPSQFLSEIDQSLVISGKPSMIETAELLKPDNTISVQNALDISKKPNLTNSLSILNPDFVKSKFTSQPFSVTHLNNFLECPWKYFFANLIRVPDIQNKHQMYGTAIHAALRTFFEAYKVERDLSKKELIELFIYQLNNQPMSSDDKSDSLKKGKESLEGYYDEYRDSWNRNLLTEYAIKIPDFKIVSDLSIVLTGKLDKIELIDEINVAVIDYKTSKPKSRNDIEGKTKSANGNYKRQLVFYQLLLNRDKRYKMNSGVIDFVEPNERSKYKKEQFIISADEIKELEELIRECADSIVSLKFSKKTCNNKDCEYCRLARVIAGE